MITRHRIHVPAALFAALPPVGQPPKIITLASWSLPASSIVLGYQLLAGSGGLTFPGGPGAQLVAHLQNPVTSPDLTFPHGNNPLLSASAWLVANTPKSIRIAANGDTPSGGEMLVDILYEEMTTVETTG
jgi:hypothetical protein